MRKKLNRGMGFQPMRCAVRRCVKPLAALSARVENPCHGVVMALICASLVCLSGCAQWNDAQLALLTQARKGVANVGKRDEQRAAAVRELATSRRQRLDDAFDQDVRERSALDADWVIAHRKAYAAGLNAYAKQQAADQASELAEKRDLAAIDAALARLQWLNSIQAKFNIVPEVSDGQH